MGKKISCALVVALATLVFAGCSKTQSEQPAGYFKTHFQDESQFIVETILADIAEMAFYAKDKALPDPKHFSVEAEEDPSSQFGAPKYLCRIQVKKGQPPLQIRLNVDRPIWSPEAYTGVAEAIFNWVKLSKPAAPNSYDDTSLLESLTDGKATTIEKESQAVSRELQLNFLNPVAHEKAALVLGAFMCRENAGIFWDIRLALCRMTAHLAFADALKADSKRCVSGQAAEALLYLGMGNEKQSLEKTEQIPGTEPEIAVWKRVLRAFNTSDHRPLSAIQDPTPIEKIAWFCTFGDCVNINEAWSKLSQDELTLPDYSRFLGTGGSVQTGHGYARISLLAELRELNEVFRAFHRGKELEEDKLVSELNRMPERCVVTGENGKAQVRVIGWGLWAMFLQRHLCHTVHCNFNFLQWRLGALDQARRFREQVDTQLGGLRLYPFVRRLNCTDEPYYHKSVDDGFRVTMETPHLVGPTAWNYLCNPVSFAAPYRPNPNPHVNEWHKHNPPPGTVYHLYPRLYHPSLTGRQDVLALLEAMHQKAPGNMLLNSELIRRKYNDKATCEQLVAVYGSTVEYAVGPMEYCAELLKDSPEKYEAAMRKVCELNPLRYFTLCRYFVDRGEEDKAAEYGEKGFKNCSDAVSVSNEAAWLIRYHLKKGNKERARELADFAGNVYSFKGLLAKAGFLEVTGDCNGAFEWYSKIDERYNSWWPLFEFCIRQRGNPEGSHFDNKLKELEKKVFPEGRNKATLKDFEQPPAKGVLIKEENELLTSAGLKKGDVIVGLNGYAVNTFHQYLYVRETSISHRLKLIVWQGDRFREIQASPPQGLFGATFVTYPENQSK